MPDTLGPYTLGYNEEPECGIYTGDARELAKAIPDESVDLIFTDPIYDRMEDYEWLSREAMRVLKPDSAALIFCGIGYLDGTIAALRAGGLTYRWQFSTLLAGGPSARFMPRGFAKWYSCLWVEKGASSPADTIVDAMISRFDDDAGLHQWSKSPVVLSHWLGRFTSPGLVVLDPFTGGGTIPAVCRQLRRRYLAFEIDPATADRARARVRQTQPPLFVVDAPEQIGLGL